MANTPSWIQVSEARTRENHLRVTISVRRWHPGFWLYGYQSVREQGFGRLVAVAVVLSMLKRAATTRRLP